MSEKLFFDFHPNKLSIFKKSDDQLILLSEKTIDPQLPFFKEDLRDACRQFSNSESEPKFTWFSTKFTLIPSALFLPNQLENYYSLNFGEVSQDEKLSYDSLNDSRLCLVYSIPKWFNDFKQNYFFKAEIRHHASVLIINTLKAPQENLISIVFEGTSFLMCIKKENKLLICNSFEFQDEEDLLYFILAHHKQLELFEISILNFMSYTEEVNSEKVLTLISHFKELNSYTINFLNKTEYNSTLRCE